ncbi:MAG: divergent polysaccharide deacetylase family protein [Candidatus Eremiobacteraeota bacterium]|nr:divergent polysaccharide deacetylase family protein [Candidatus Eremiobacteraeota bacterium]
MLISLLLLAVAVSVGWLLFRPIPHPHHRRPSRPASSPVASRTAATAAPRPSAQPRTSAEASGAAAPAASPSGVVSPIVTTSAPTVAKLALIIDDCGQWIGTERDFVALPIPLTLSVLPDVRYGGIIAREASGAGKGVMLHLPMETISGMNPGPGKVTTEMTDAQIAAQVESDLAQVPLASGVNNHEGSKASADPRVMRDVIGDISKHGSLFFIDSKTNAASVAEAAATNAGVPTAARDVFLDNENNVDYSEAQLRKAAAIAKRTGSAIAIGHPRAATLAAVKALIPQLQTDGIEFVLAGSLTH